MALFHSPRIITNGLVLALDGANSKSFRGPAQTNIIPSITATYSNQNGTFFKIANGIESVNIPTVGMRSARYVDIYNDYIGGSGNCCPSPFTFGSFSSGVSGNTTYTYSILYKSETGYTHPNYMYRYEYNGGTYVTEAGVHNTSNRTHLGDGWYHAWGTFTTQPTTNLLTCYLFHYEYATYNRIYVAAVQITQGTYIGAPQHMLAPGQVRGATVATGGGWSDLSISSQLTALVNGVGFNSANGGTLVVDGIDDFILTDEIATYGSATTWEAWVYCTANVNTYNMFMGRYLPYFGFFNGNSLYFSNNIGGSQRTIQTATNLSLNTWYHATFTTAYDGTNTTMKIYTNGVETATGTWAGIQSNYSYKFMIGDGNNGVNNSWYPFQGRISNVKVYNKNLTSQEILQNFNTTRSRFGV